MALPRFNVSLRFFGSHFDPNDLSRELQLVPVRSWKAGERRTTPKGTVLNGTQQESYCSFHIETGSEQDLGEALQAVVASLKDYDRLFHRFRENGGRTELFVGFFLGKGDAGSVLPYTMMNDLGRLGIDIALNIYSCPSPGALTNS